MPTTSRSLRTVAWSALAFSTARAYVIDNMSFGHKPDAYISPDLHNVPHWTYQGKDDFMPQILSDRIILTPPYPGGKRGSIWANDPFHHTGDWTTELDFRVSGMDRGAGNLQLWYVKESQARETPASLYTVGRFDGLVIVVDQYEGRGGSVRGFLNDGSVDMKSHAHPDTLAFGKCDYAYRNRGILSTIKLHHTDTFIEVLVDGHTCFKTDKVKLPEGYYFGISASSAENPDSFEVHKFLTSSANKDTRENPIRGYGTPQDHQAQQNIAMQNAHEQETHKQTQHHSFGSPTDQTSIPKMLEDAVAGTIRSQQDQFADLHNRIQIINNRVAEMFELVERMADTNDQRFNAIMHRLVPVDDRGAATIKNVEKIERTTMSILRDLESKDFKDMMQQIHRALENNQEGLTRTLPVAMNAVYAGHKPSVTTFLFIAIAVQIMITGAYIVYKKRRTGAKKYL